MKRRASLVGRPSVFHSGVTIFEPIDLVRRSKRLKVSSTVASNPPTPGPTSFAETDGALTNSSASVSKTSHSDSCKTNVSLTAQTTHDLERAPEPSTEATRPQKPKRVASSRKFKPIPTALDVPHPEPERWRDVYDTIKRMRQRIVAPVDTMGCEQAQLKETDPKNQRFSTLVSLMLSSQTKDEVTDAAVAKLREAVGGTLSIDAILEASESAVSEAICKVGFWRRKTLYIRQAAKKLKDDFGGDVPKTVDELCSLPGVGPKMAFLALQVAWKVNAGIGVDVHVHRITNRLGWHNHPTKTPEETRLNLQSWLPVELHPEINHLLVGFGQTVCAPIGPKCDQCELSDGLCPSARKASSSKKRSKKGKSADVDMNQNAGPMIEVEIVEESEITK